MDNHKMRLIESDKFQFEFLSQLADIESWRKEIYRPVYHIHKWWAKRLGSVFRGIVLGSVLQEDANLLDEFYKDHSFDKIAVFDPFMGSGTTIGEAHKLGCIALGRDINPVACESVRIAMGRLNKNELKGTFEKLYGSVGERIRNLYKSFDEKKETGEVLYYFWVKQIGCLYCSHIIDLFSSRVIARNVYMERKPEIQVCCPRCGDIFEAHAFNQNATCRSCKFKFSHDVGAVRGSIVSCSNCHKEFTLLDAIKKSNKPLEHRLYAKLILTQGGTKKYLPTDKYDLDAYQASKELLTSEINKGKIKLPFLLLEDGFNTRQVLNYNYREWREFFNDRQLLALGWLHSAIGEIKSSETREAFLILFSGLLEFNNMFASYKGEGTGAVRHMFAHHILKPEKMPIEANVWGTPKSSGAFCNLFKNRLLRAIDYREAPFEVSVEGKIFNLSRPFSGVIEPKWPTENNFKPRAIYLSCGSSDETDLRDKSIDYIITDPPFFDNVHYSELADFFYAWQQLNKRGFLNSSTSTRNVKEVQDAKPEAFSAKLRNVFKESNRLLKDDGLLIFSYHHSKPEGWASLTRAVLDSGFSIINAHPVKAEMSVATPKSQAKEPIQLDIILVCSKKEKDRRMKKKPIDAFSRCSISAGGKISRLRSVGLKLSKNDAKIIFVSTFLSLLGPVDEADEAIKALIEYEDKLSKGAELTLQANIEPYKNGVIQAKELQVYDLFAKSSA